MAGSVTILDYGVGNVLSVIRAITAAGGQATVAEHADQIVTADRLLLPGVGAFGHCADILRQKSLLAPLRDFATTGKPFLGICVGMQLLLEESTEFGLHAGLGLIPGRVERLESQGTDGQTHKIPYVGWNQLQHPVTGQDWTGSVLDGLDGNSWAYFTHSYAARPVDPNDVLAESDYFGHRVATAVRRDNVTGCQFHPEKSGAVGLNILGNFVRS